MSQEPTDEHISKKRVKYDLPGAERVAIRAGVECRGADGNSLTMDLYYPPDLAPAARTPAVVMVTGYPDAGMQRFLGCSFTEMGSTVSWARLIAASGMVAVACTNREPAADLDAARMHLCEHAAALGVDATKIGTWACSGNAALALSTMLRDASGRPACAALLYGCLMDLDGATGTSDMAALYRFANPCAGKSIADLAGDVPLLLVRAGRDEMPRLNETLDRFVDRAIRADLPLTVVNVPGAPHAFDLVQDSESTRRAVRQVLDFLRLHLVEIPAAERAGGRKSR